VHALGLHFGVDIQVEMAFQGRNLAKIKTCFEAGFLRPNRIFAMETITCWPAHD
jgi:hypothetical protein